MKLETEASYKTIEAYKKAASEAGLVLKPGENTIRDSGDYPSHAYTNLRYLRRVAAVGKEKEPTKIVEKLSRQLVIGKGNGKLVRKDHLTIWGHFKATDHRGVERYAGFEQGKYQKPKIISEQFHATLLAIFLRFEDADERNCENQEEISPEVSLLQ